MDEPTLEALEQRLDGLELENRGLKRLCTLAFVAITGLIIMGQAAPSKPPKFIDAEGFGVRDPSGKLRAILGVNKDGAVSLTLTDNNERPRIFLKVPRDGDAGIALFQRAGSGRSVLSEKGLWLSGKDGKVRAEVALSDFEPRFVLFDKDEKPRATVELSESGDPKLNLTDKSGTNRTALGVYKGQPLLVFTDSSEKVIWKAP